MTKHDLLTYVKTSTAINNGDSVRLHNGPSALIPPPLTTSELQALFIFSVVKWKSAFYAQFCMLSHSENRRQETLEGSLALGGSDQISMSTKL